MTTSNFTPISLDAIVQAVDVARSINAASKVREALELSSDTLFQLNASTMTMDLVGSAEAALLRLEMLEAQSGGTHYSDAVAIQRKLFDLRMNGATLEEIDSYLERVEITLQ